MKNFIFTKENYLQMICTNGFIIEGFEDITNKNRIEYWLYNISYGIKQHIFTIEKDFNFEEWLKYNYNDICDDYLERFGD